MNSPGTQAFDQQIQTHPETYQPQTVEQPEGSAHIAHEFMTVEQASAIVAKAAGGKIDYQMLAGFNNYPPAWGVSDETSETTEAVPYYDNQIARQGLDTFLRMFSDEFTQKAGVTPIPEEVDLSAFGNMEGLMQMSVESGYQRVDEGDQNLLPDMSYQTPRQRGDANDPAMTRSAFLHFGLLYYSPKDPRLNSPELTERVRLYLNPTIEHTAEAAAILCQGFIDSEGYMPTGKFMEDATSWRVEERDDRLLFWLRTPKELTTILKLTQKLQSDRPEFFADQNPIMLGEPIIVGGVELPTARLAQQLHSQDGEPTSFNNVSVQPIQQALQAALHDKEPGTDEDSMAADFLTALRASAPAYGRHPESFAFNADQDLAVIDQALAAV